MFEIRCAQLDLARQKESLEFIRSFIDFLSENGYNALHLYLEDRIRTHSYPYPTPEESYSPAEIRRLVAYAGKRGIEVFPCVGTLGHAERFLSHPELQHLAELRGGRRGRFGGTRMSEFCPSLPEVLEFLEKYLSEVAALFPSRYFHAGLDEFWDFVICDECRKAAPDYTSEGQLFLRHVKSIHDCLARLGKRMVMWTDMIEFYPEILPQLPRDIVMADWQYQPDVRFLRDHFNNSSATSLDKYDKLGFDVWLCPADRYYSNGVTYLQYARRFPCVKGAMFTTWEKSDTFLFRSLPMIAAFGRLLNGMHPDLAFDAAASALFPKADAAFLMALRWSADNIFPRHYQSSSYDAIFIHDANGACYPELDARRMCLVAFESMQDCIPAGDSLAKAVLDDLVNSTQECIRSLEMNFCAHDILFYGTTTDRIDSFRKMAASYMGIYRERQVAWEKYRPGIPNIHAEKLKGIEERLERFARELEAGRFLRIRMAHNDWYGINGIRAFLRIRGKWQLVWKGVAKPHALDHTQMLELFIPLPEPKLMKAEALRLEYYGYGGCGVTYASIVENGVVIRRPEAIIALNGEVSHPEHLLTDDSRTAFIGDQNMRHTYLHKELFDTGTAVEVSLKPAN